MPPNPPLPGNVLPLTLEDLRTTLSPERWDWLRTHMNLAVLNDVQKPASLSPKPDQPR